ncbi:ISKra4 family transposase [Micromonospora sp. Llam0]|uniref:ISKra4 family transposase n=1 Tax=Micromonospora sp. Llam0 TaxID=2485143 RepID=UPI00351A8343
MVAGAFDRSRECFEELVEGLAGSDSDGLTHAELEDRLAVRGRELLRLLLQDHVDLRAAREVRRERVVGADEVVRSRVEVGHGRGLGTVFGAVTVTRMAYRASGVANLYPADAVLNLPVERHSHGLRRLAAVESVRGSFDDAVAAIDRSCGVGVGKRQVQELAVAAAVDVAAFYDTRSHRPVGDGWLLVLSFDGKGVVMIPSALRDATAKAAARTGRRLTTRLSPGEKRGRKRMAELAVVYDAAPVPRTPSEIITGDDGRRRRGPVAQARWLTASVVDDIAPVVAAGFDEACRRDPRQARTWVVLVDGNRAQIDAVRAEADRRQVKVHIVLDFVHVLEYVWKAAWAFFYTGDPAAEAWVGEQAVKILSGKAGQVAAGIRRRATRYGYSARERAGADECADYLTRHQPYLDYHTALAAGWPIATGVIEGACRHLVKDRMDITGARWGLDTAEAILKLRAVSANGDFNAYWAFHLQQEHQRIHQNRYQQQREGYTLAG